MQSLLEKSRVGRGYRASTPRAALGLIAVTMAASTIGLLVVLPAKLDSASAEPSTAAAETKPAADTSVDVVIGLDADRSSSQQSWVHAAAVRTLTKEERS